MSSSTAELVLSLVQWHAGPVHLPPAVFAATRCVSRFLRASGDGRTCPPAPPAPAWVRIELARSKRERCRVTLGGGRYLERELPLVRAALGVPAAGLPDSPLVGSVPWYSGRMKRDGWYVPVMYPRQSAPLYSLVFEKAAAGGGAPAAFPTRARADPEEAAFLTRARAERIRVVPHTEVPFTTDTQYVRWSDAASLTRQRPRVTIG